MIGSMDMNEKTAIDDLFIPMLDGDVVRYDKKGFFEVTNNLYFIYIENII